MRRRKLMEISTCDDVKEVLVGSKQGYAMAHVTDMLKLTTTKRDGYMKNPFERVTGQKVDLEKLLLLIIFHNSMS